MSPTLTRRRFGIRCGLAPLAGLAACGTAVDSLPAGTAAALAPGGRLRACMAQSLARHAIRGAVVAPAAA
jgi:polar amino acid transport system substrate-binding protein